MSPQARRSAKKSRDGAVFDRLVSPDGVMFLTGGSNEVLHLYDEDGFAARVSLAAWRARLNARANFFKRHGIAWRQLLAPEKLSVCGEALLPDDAVSPGARLVRSISDQPDLAGALVDPCAFLRAQAKRGYSVFPRTDSHWTPVGAFSAFQWLAASLGLDPDGARFLDMPERAVSYTGDLAVPGTDGPEMFYRRVAPPGLLRTYANPVVALKERLGQENAAGLHVGSHVSFHAPHAPFAQRVVLFGSSFSDYRLECSLMTLCAALYFRELHFIWSTSLDLALIGRLSPDLVIIETPERFLTACPDDCFDLASYAARLVASW
jgi:alginate O-acetyltransferase complex protein AlgJ